MTVTPPVTFTSEAFSGEDQKTINKKPNKTVAIVSAKRVNVNFRIEIFEFRKISKKFCLIRKIANRNIITYYVLNKKAVNEIE